MNHQSFKLWTIATTDSIKRLFEHFLAIFIAPKVYIFSNTSGEFPTTKVDIWDETQREFTAKSVVTKTLYFKVQYDLF